jgi:hypothetical protein
MPEVENEIEEKGFPLVDDTLYTLYPLTDTGHDHTKIQKRGPKSLFIF